MNVARAFFAVHLGWVLAVAGAAALSAADESPRAVSLVRPNSLTGWTHGEAYPLGWTVDGQRLRGGQGSTPLVSAWHFGDFRLEFTLAAQADGVLQVQLPDAAGGPGLTFELLAAPRPDASPQRAVIERKGEMVFAILDGERLALESYAADARLGLVLQVPRGVITLENVTISEPAGESLFNGADLSGWWTHKKPDVWQVENGELVTTKQGGEYLRSEREFGDFTLSFEYRLDQGGNSGVDLRTPRTGWPSGDGLELQLLDRPGRDASSQMSLYKHFPPLERPDVSGEWNHVVIKTCGRVITAWVNGQLAQHADTAARPSTAGKPLSGWIGFQNHGSKTRVRQVQLLAAEGQPAEKSPQAP